MHKRKTFFFFPFSSPSLSLPVHNAFLYLLQRDSSTAAAADTFSSPGLASWWKAVTTLFSTTAAYLCERTPNPTADKSMSVPRALVKEASQSAMNDTFPSGSTSLLKAVVTAASFTVTTTTSSTFLFLNASMLLAKAGIWPWQTPVYAPTIPTSTVFFPSKMSFESTSWASWPRISFTLAAGMEAPVERRRAERVFFTSEEAARREDASIVTGRGELESGRREQNSSDIRRRGSCLQSFLVPR
mmetsp:Transcript_9081/g.24688  ORF Transcript_9081/g.24688 Transcript_9081/m.24688 type:complete len:243 (+) Transcript_9081:91-819(+)